MGVRAPVAPSTFTDANRVRDWRITQLLIHTARRLHSTLRKYREFRSHSNLDRVLRLNIPLPLYTTLQILSLTAFERMPHYQ